MYKKLFFNEINPFRIYEMHFVREILLLRLFGKLTIVREDNMELIKKGVFGIYVKNYRICKEQKKCLSDIGFGGGASKGRCLNRCFSQNRGNAFLANYIYFFYVIKIK